MGYASTTSQSQIPLRACCTPVGLFCFVARPSHVLSGSFALLPCHAIVVCVGWDFSGSSWQHALYSGNIHAHRPWSLKLWGWTKRCQAPSSTRLLPVTRYLLCTSSIARRSRIAHRQSYTASAFSKPLPVNWPLIISCCTRLTTKNPGVERASL